MVGAVVKSNFQPASRRLRNAASVVLLGNKAVCHLLSNAELWRRRPESGAGGWGVVV